MRGVARWFVVVAVMSGCGPDASDFIGNYPVTAEETIDDCSGPSSPVPTALRDITEITITERTDTFVFVEMGPCGFVAEVTDKNRFETDGATCNVEYEPPEIVITFSAVGTVEKRSIDLTLTGTYETTSLGYDVVCTSYTLHATGS